MYCPCVTNKYNTRFTGLELFNCNKHEVVGDGSVVGGIESTTSIDSVVDILLL